MGLMKIQAKKKAALGDLVRCCVSKSVALAIGYAVSGLVVFGSYKMFGAKGLLAVILFLVVDQVYYRIKHGHWQKTVYADD